MKSPERTEQAWGRVDFFNNFCCRFSVAKKIGFVLEKCVDETQGYSFEIGPGAKSFFFLKLVVLVKRMCVAGR